SSWLTGIEPNLLVLRLLPAFLMIAVLSTTAALAMRLADRPWAGPIAALLACLPAYSPFLWSESPASDNSVLIESFWASPTQQFGTILFTGALAVLAPLIRAEKGAA